VSNAPWILFETSAKAGAQVLISERTNASASRAGHIMLQIASH